MKVENFKKLYDLLGVEIFASGIHKGDEYTNKDLDKIVAAASEVGFTPPLKDGHHDDKDGLPSLGWVTNLRRIGSKLVGDFKDMPKIVYDAIKDHRYDRVSSEIYFKFRNGKKMYDKVLKAVALLGAEIPAVRELRPLREQFSSGDCEWKMYEEDSIELVNFNEVYVDKLPDAAFALILPGGKKDEEGKTTPRSLRKFPHHAVDVKDPSDNETIELFLLSRSLHDLSEMEDDLTTKQLASARSHLRQHEKSLREENKMYDEEKGLAQKGISFTVGKVKGVKEPVLVSISFDKDSWNEKEGKEWLEENEFKSEDIHIKKGKQFEALQNWSEGYVEGSLQTITPKEKIQGVDDVISLYKEVQHEQEVKMEERIKKLEETIAKLTSDSEKVLAEKDKEVKELSDKLAQSEKKLSELTPDEEKLKALEQSKKELEEKEKKFSEVEKKNRELEESIRTDRVKSKTDAIKLPALRPYFKMFYDVATTGEKEKVIKFSADGKEEKDQSMESITDEFAKAMNKLADSKIFSEVSGMEEFKREEKGSIKDPKAEVATRVSAYMEKEGEQDYAKGLTAVLNADPELKKAYANS